MPNIKPISDYNVISDIAEYEREQAIMDLLSELAEGERSIAENGVCSLEDVERELGI